MAIFLSLLYLTRPDSIYYIGLICMFLAISSLKPLKLDFRFLAPFGIFFVTFLGHTTFRYHYYGELIPNTVLLKVVNFPFSIRIETGLYFVSKYLLESIVILLVSAASIIYPSKRPQKFIFLVFIWATIFYQIYVGGDAWDYWRFFVPIFPLIMILFFSTVGEVFSDCFISKPWLRYVLSILIFIVGFSAYNWQFFKELTLSEPPYQVVYNEDNVNYALRMEDFLSEGGRVAVFWAGAIPYYTDYYFIDILGKMDKKIASRDIYINKKADFGKRTVPGHNKFDLKYSLIELDPDVAQNVSWMNQNIGGSPGFDFESYRYKGKEYWVRKKSLNVDFVQLSR
uniref:Glycosyltransferase RgtA/B/C/D-like domain-containing protein n=1 Tax=candidate division WWE3 bacterium TaxID=2053526 RepID=A0A7C4XT95_UNCKA